MSPIELFNLIVAGSVQGALTICLDERFGPVTFDLDLSDSVEPYIEFAEAQPPALMHCKPQRFGMSLWGDQLSVLRSNGTTGGLIRFSLVPGQDDWLCEYWGKALPVLVCFEQTGATEEGAEATTPVCTGGAAV